jgi:hypothetical protein
MALMAIFISGVPCRLCGEPMSSAQDVVMFGAFVANQAAPLLLFSDGSFHAACFQRHPLADAALARYQECQERISPSKRICIACERLITDPDDYLGVGHLVDDPAHPLNSLNYAHFHRTCLPRWPGVQGLLKELETLNVSGTWKGAALEKLIGEISPSSQRH